MAFWPKIGRGASTHTMNAANLQLSTEEKRLVSDPGVILTKNSIIKKVVGLFAELSEQYRTLGEKYGSPKISKGENYRGLPYVMLDYPRLFGREEVLAIRTFFWWGHGFSVTLHLKGGYRERYLPVLQQRWAELVAAGFHVGVSEEEWRHEHGDENYRPITSAEDLVVGVTFLKLSAACGLDRWEEAQDILSKLFRVLVDVIGL